MTQDIILSRLLDKYERSKHLLQPGSSNRRVMLCVNKKELPEYNYEDAEVRDEWNNVIHTWVEDGLVFAEWVADRPVLSAIILNLDHVKECYQRIGRTHPAELAQAVDSLISTRLSSVATEWIASWRDMICSLARTTARVPAYCKKDLALLAKLVDAFAEYDALHGEPITMRAFSSRCYHNTKTFEYEIRDLFLRVAAEYAPGLAEACAQEKLGEREQLAFLGIYARPELYELAGCCTLRTQAGALNLFSVAPYGIALPSTAVDAVLSIDLNLIHSVILIENKTNYDEFIISEQRQDELVIYHGGFLSPQKEKFLQKIRASLDHTVPVFFWADIDLGGFQMFERLQAIFPGLVPMRMSGKDVEDHHANGLKRSDPYLAQVQNALDQGKFPIFREAMEKILEFGVTIEQEVFLTE